MALYKNSDPGGTLHGAAFRRDVLTRATQLAAGLLFPPPSYIRYRYDLQNNWQALLRYPYRWWDAASEIFGLPKPPPKRRGHKR